MIKQYLGDGLYAEWNDDQLVLKANDPDDPSDVVFLDVEVIKSLFHFIKSIPLSVE